MKLRLIALTLIVAVLGCGKSDEPTKHYGCWCHHWCPCGNCICKPNLKCSYPCHCEKAPKIDKK